MIKYRINNISISLVFQTTPVFSIFTYSSVSKNKPNANNINNIYIQLFLIKLQIMLN